MTNLYVIHAFENQYSGLHGREDLCVMESDNLEDAILLAREMSEGVMYEWNYDGYEDDGIAEGLEEGSDELEDYCMERMREDNAFSIYKVIDTKGLSCDELDEKLNKEGIESFIEEHCDENPVY